MSYMTDNLKYDWTDRGYLFDTVYADTRFSALSSELD